MKKYYILILISFIIFISACKVQETLQGNKQKYENKDLGIAFEYPQNFKIYQSDKNTISIDSGYEDTEHPLLQISIGIKKFSPNKESLEKIKSMTQPFADWTKSELTYNIQNKGNYDIVIVESSFGYLPYYILSDRGSFVVDHPGPIWKEQLTESLYSDYKMKFDAIIESIKII
ncbi:hypothetical protein HYS31_04115 [Candidatus Woesearchaeota archaeon]|nr:hypothetical protein [Candidatus Woesearchaeota archaeon]